LRSSCIRVHYDYNWNTIQATNNLADNTVKEDILVTKRGQPFVVIIDAKRYDTV